MSEDLLCDNHSFVHARALGSIDMWHVLEKHWRREHKLLLHTCAVEYKTFIRAYTLTPRRTFWCFLAACWTVIQVWFFNFLNARINLFYKVRLHYYCVVTFLYYRYTYIITVLSLSYTVDIRTLFVCVCCWPIILFVNCTEQVC